jgi:hypothetical protein
MIVSEQLWLNPEINRFAEERLFSAGITTFFRKSEPLLERCNQSTLSSVSFWRLQHVAQDKANQPKVDGFMVWSITLTSRSLWWVDRAL